MTRPTLERSAVILMVAVCLWAFGGVAKNGFINFDDGIYVYANPHVQSGLTFQGVLWAFKTMNAANWHPITWLSHMLDCQLYGLNPAGHHLTNLFLHIANALLLFLLLQNATGRFWESFAVASLFALHPLRVESVAWLSERKDVLSGFFAMLAMLAYVHYTRRRSPGRYALTLFLFALGLMAKPMLITLPFIFLLLDFWPLQRSKVSRIPGHSPELTFHANDQGLGVGALVIEKVPFFALSAASSLVTFIAQYKGGAVSSFELVPFKIRLINAWVSYWNYLEKIFWPSNLTVFYPHPVNQLQLWEGLVAALFLVVASSLVISQARRRPFLFTGWFWFLIMLIPVIGIIQVGGQSMADRYTYLPSIGMFIIIAWTLPSLSWPAFHIKFLITAGFVAILILLSIITWVQTGYWKENETLFRHAAALTTRNYLAHTLLGDALAAENKLDMAQIEYEKALAIWPQFPEAHNNLGMVLAKRGLHQEAMSHYEEVLRINPKNAAAHVNIASELAEQGEFDRAALHYVEALQIEPDSVTAHSGLGVVLACLQKMDRAIPLLTKAVELCPQCAETHNNLGRVQTLHGNFEAAAKHLQRAIELNPAYAEAYNNMGLLFVQLGALEEALYYFSAALHFKDDYSKARTNLKEIITLLAQAKRTDVKAGMKMPGTDEYNPVHSKESSMNY
jgi:protein O-mannosyl-transferase